LGPGRASWIVELEVVTSILVPGAQAVSVEKINTHNIRKIAFFISLPPKQYC
jgi:hypothetical protein